MLYKFLVTIKYNGYTTTYTERAEHCLDVILSIVDEFGACAISIKRIEESHA